MCFFASPTTLPPPSKPKLASLKISKHFVLLCLHHNTQYVGQKNASRNGSQTAHRQQQMMEGSVWLFLLFVKRKRAGLHRGREDAKAGKKGVKRESMYEIPGEAKAAAGKRESFAWPPPQKESVRLSARETSARAGGAMGFVLLCLR
jgi:hypothetical protein